MLKELFVSGRYLFGYLAPGVLWIAAAFVLASDNATLKLWLKSASATELALLMSAGFIVGNAMIGWSFWFAVTFSSLLYNLLDVGRFRKAKLISPGVSPELLKQVRRILQKSFGNDEYIESLEGWKLFDFCKRVVIQTSPVLGQHLLEVEAEVNLRASFALPLIIFGGAWAWHGWPQRTELAVAAFLFLIAFRLLKTTHDIRLGEVHQGFESFLTVQTLDKKQGPPNAVVTG